MRRIKKIIIISLIVTILLTVRYTSSEATSQTNQPYIKISVDNSNFEVDKTIEIAVTLENATEKISYLDAYINYDTNLFQEVSRNDFTIEISEDMLNYFSYSKKASKIVMEFVSDIEVKEIFKLKLKVLDTVENIDNTYFKLESPSIYSYQKDITVELENATKIINEKSNTETDEKIYITSEIYKIGENDINNYVEGDKYISRIEKETTKSKFIESLRTNGKVRIIKEDGTELGEDELLGTGMAIEVTKEEEKVEMKIAVTGDLNGDGKLTATDLSTLNQTILKIVTLENEYKIAGDLDENDNITATDLSTLNKLILKLL